MANLNKILKASAAAAAMAFATNAGATVALPATETITSGQSYYMYNIGKDAWLTYGNFYSVSGRMELLKQTTYYQFTITTASADTCYLQNVAKGTSLYTFNDGTGLIFVDHGNNTDAGTTFVFTKSGDYYTINNVRAGASTYMAATSMSQVSCNYTTDNDYSHWILVSTDNIDVTAVKIELYKMIQIASEVGVSTTDAETAYNNSSATAETLAKALSTLETSVWSAKTDGASASAGKDVSYLLRQFENVNGCTGIKNQLTQDDPVGWTVTKANVNEGCDVNAPGLAEYYASKANGSFTLNYTVNLQPGVYKYSIKGFERYIADGGTAYNAGTEVIKTSLTVTVGEETTQTKINSLYSADVASVPTNMTTAKAAFDNGYYDNDVVFTVSEAGDVTIGLTTGDNTLDQKSWVIFAGATLTYYGKGSTISINGESDYTPESGAGDVEFTRSLTNGTWAAMVLPFDIPSTAIEGAFGTGATIIDLQNATYDSDNDVVNLIFNSNNAQVKANVPFLVKPAKDITSIQVEGTIISTEGVQAYTKGVATLKGTYSTISNLYKTEGSENGDVYYIGGGKWKKAASTSTVKVKPFRAYLQTVTSTNAKVNVIIDGVADEDNTTGINEALQQTNSNATLYNLNGQKVSADYKGLTVKNGKKFINK